MTTLDPTIIAASIVTVVAALAAAIVTIINATASAADRRDARVGREALIKTTDATNRKADVLIEKTAEIHTVTNSNLSAVTKNLELALQKISGLETDVARMAREKDEAKQALVAPTAAIVSGDHVEVVKQGDPSALVRSGDNVKIEKKTP